MKVAAVAGGGEDGLLGRAAGMGAGFLTSGLLKNPTGTSFVSSFIPSSAAARFYGTGPPARTTKLVRKRFRTWLNHISWWRNVTHSRLDHRGVGVCDVASVDLNHVRDDESWSGRRDSNPRHQAWEACTLPTELRPPSRQRCLIIST